MNRSFLYPNALVLLLGLLLGSACDKMDPLNQNVGEFGIVKDYTGLDGCGFIIELDNGNKLEPVSLEDTAFVFKDGERVYVEYTPLQDYGSICMVGITAHIDSIIGLDCAPITQVGYDFSYDTLPDDMLVVHSAQIVEDCLYLTVKYSGGCKDHSFDLYLLRSWCATPPVPPPTLLIGHDAKGDMCEAYITETLSFDLTPLRDPDTSSAEFYLRPVNMASSYMEIFNYEY